MRTSRKKLWKKLQKKLQKYQRRICRKNYSKNFWRNFRLRKCSKIFGTLVTLTNPWKNVRRIPYKKKSRRHPGTKFWKKNRFSAVFNLPPRLINVPPFSLNTQLTQVFLVGFNKGILDARPLHCFSTLPPSGTHAVRVPNSSKSNLFTVRSSSGCVLNRRPMCVFLLPLDPSNA